MDDYVLRIQIKHVNREAHGEGMHTPARSNPETSAGGEIARRRANQSAQPRPVGARRAEPGGEIRLTGNI